jgi:succinate dehydrogenase/fumarate reductase flavoprotein subunit
LLVGGGGAGLRAAIAIAETSPRLRVAVVSKVYPMRSHTVSAEGGAAGVIGSDDSLDEHAYDTISGGDWLSDQDAVEAFVKEAPQELLRLEHWGCPWSRQPDGRIGVRPFGGMKKMRTWFAADKTGFHMLHTLFQTSLKYTSVVRYDEWFVTKLLVDDGRVQGVVAIELMSGKIETITARAVILCTGGCGRVFPFTTNAAIKNGDGMALAYRAGAPLKDMEFVQYHPTGLPFTGILITEAARAEGGYLINKDGYRYLQDYNLGKPDRSRSFAAMELGLRDRLSQAFVKEVEKDGPSTRHTVPSSISTCVIHGRDGHRREDSLRARAVPQVSECRSGDGAHSRAAGCPLHDGRRRHRHQRRDATGRVVRGRGGRLRQHQRRQPAGIELPARTAGLRRARRTGRRGVRLLRSERSGPRRAGPGNGREMADASS